MQSIMCQLYAAYIMECKIIYHVTAFWLVSTKSIQLHDLVQHIALRRMQHHIKIIELQSMIGLCKSYIIYIYIYMLSQESAQVSLDLFPYGGWGLRMRLHVPSAVWCSSMAEGLGVHVGSKIHLLTYILQHHTSLLWLLKYCRWLVYLPGCNHAPWEYFWVEDPHWVFMVCSGPTVQDEVTI